MKCYYDYLKSKNINCTYINIHENWINKVNKEIDKDSLLYFYDPVDHYVEKLINDNFDQYDIINTPRFILSTDEMESYNGAIRQTSFYGWIRKLKNILMNNSIPIGNRLTYDSDNRKHPYDGIEDDVDDNINKNYMDNKYVQEAIRYIDNYSKKAKNQFYESDYELKFPIDRKGSISRLNYFIKYNLSRFGDYQDVMIDSTDNSFIFHSAISPMMNIGLLTPEEVIDTIIEHYNKLNKSNKNKMIHNIEGFIRQILGWREFSRYMYEHHSDSYIDKNFFNAKNKLSKEWYGPSGNTGLIPIDNCIEKAWKYGYLHHIERLMIISNYMVLTGISPNEMYKWFMEFSLDSYDWVMEYNVYCMASYSDGGQYTSKPYISTSKYILNMSNYADDDVWTTEWDQLFWKFLNKHKNKIKHIGRLSMLLKYIPKKHF
jgi:deoxyribodipyrimidine photolyase-related protein